MHVLRPFAWHGSRHASATDQTVQLARGVVRVGIRHAVDRKRVCHALIEGASHLECPGRGAVAVYHQYERVRAGERFHGRHESLEDTHRCTVDAAGGEEHIWRS